MTLWNRHRWWILRLVLLPVNLLLFAIVSFFLVRSIPGDPVVHVLGPNYTPEAYDAMQHELGLDGSLIDQAVRYVGGLLRFDLGTSITTARPVLDDFLARMPSTVELAVLGLGIALLLSALAAYVAVVRPRLWLSTTIRFYARTAGSVPEYVIAVLALFVFYTLLGWAPAPDGRISAMLEAPPVVTGFPLLDALVSGYGLAAGSIIAHYAVPIGVLVVANAGIVLRILLEGLDEAVTAPPTRFRIATGARHRTVVASMFRRAAPPAVTMAATMFGYLLGGTVILESLFGFAGIGQYLVDAVKINDVISIQGFLLAIATISLLVFLVMDIVNMIIDPRRRPGFAGGGRS